MGHIRKIALLLFLFAVACDNKNKTTEEMVYEEIVLYSCRYRYYDYSHESQESGGRLLINLIAGNQSDYKKVYFYRFPSWETFEDYRDMEKEIRKYRIEFQKDSLSVFFTPAMIEMKKIDLNSKVGTVFYNRYCEDFSEEEKLENACLLFESQIFDTVFNNILHVKRCFHYSCLLLDVENLDTDCHIYYDVDRCIFVHVEMRTPDTNELIFINRVEKANKIDSSYFKERWDNAVETEHILIPSICPTSEL
jgi:hypothetical protein